MHTYGDCKEEKEARIKRALKIGERALKDPKKVREAMLRKQIEEKAAALLQQWFGG